ncbi:MAG: hypothetical protein GY845_03535 [Planctomycetes bacterium]|nr:hypothetical protein [Planctomycetota bacterium]
MIAKHMTEKKEQIEGIDTDMDDGWGEYPLDSVFVRKETRSISEVVKGIEAGRYILAPDFQRDFIWDIQKKEKRVRVTPLISNPSQ